MHARLWLLAAGLMLLSMQIAAQPLRLIPGTAPDETLGLSASFNFDLPPDSEIQDLVSADFQPGTQVVPNFGLNQEPIWIKLEVVNPTDNEGQWILSLNRTLLDELRVLFYESGQLSELLTEAERIESYRNYGTLAANFSLSAGEAGAIYVLYQGSNSSILPLSIETEVSAASNQLWALIIFFVSLAGVATLVVYNTVLAIITRLPAFLMYGLAQTVMFAYFTHLSGLTTIYLWPETPEVGSRIAPVLAILTAMFNALFVKSFVDRALIPNWLNSSFTAIVYGSLAALALITLGALFGIESTPLNGFAVLVSLVTAILLPITGVMASRERRLRYFPMTAAWMWYALSVVYTSFTVSNWAPVIPQFTTLYVGFAFVEAILLSISLALEVRHIDRTRMTAQKDLAKSLSEKLEESRRKEDLMRERSLALSDIVDRGRLLQAAGHDTRQALFALKQFAAGLNENNDPDRTARAANSITQLAKHVDDVLATTLVGAHGGSMIDQVLALESINLVDLIEPIRLIYQRAAVKKNLGFRIVTRDAEIVTDRVLLIRILSNLVGNAIKYTDRGGVLIGCRILSDRICIQIWDTGRGIDAAQLELLLDPKHSAVRYAETQEGLGSGLQTCLTLAQKIGVSLTARSVPGKGTVFDLEIPVLGKAEQSTIACWLVDNDALTPKWLEAANWSFDTILPEASHLPVLIDFDYGSPAGGLKLAKELKANFPNIVLTSYDHAADIRNACAEASQYLLYKPLQQATLQTLAVRLQMGEDSNTTFAV